MQIHQIYTLYKNKRLFKMNNFLFIYIDNQGILLVNIVKIILIAKIFKVLSFVLDIKKIKWTFSNTLF